MALLDLHALATMIPPGYRLTFALENVGAGGTGVVTSSALPLVAAAAPQAERGTDVSAASGSSKPLSAASAERLDDDTPLGRARLIAADQPTLELTAAE